MKEGEQNYNLREEDSEKEKGLEEFVEALKGWMRCSGDDLCPECWHQLLLRHDKEMRKTIRSESAPLNEKSVAETRKSADGWHVICENYAECKQEVFIPYQEK